MTEHITDLSEFLQRHAVVVTTASYMPEKPEYLGGMFYYYAIRHSDANFDRPVTIEKHVVVNRWGWVVLDAQLPPLEQAGAPDWLKLDKKSVKVLRSRSLGFEYHRHILEQHARKEEHQLCQTSTQKC